MLPLYQLSASYVKKLSLLKRQVGSGGFGKVFLAEHTTNKTRVALKVLHTFSDDDDEEEKEAYAEAIAAFQQEFRILQQMQRTHIVHVLDGQLEGETPYVAMEYCSYGAFARRYPLGGNFPAGPDCLTRAPDRVRSELRP